MIVHDCDSHGCSFTQTCDLATARILHRSSMIADYMTSHTSSLPAQMDASGSGYSSISNDKLMVDSSVNWIRIESCSFTVTAPTVLPIWSKSRGGNGESPETKFPLEDETVIGVNPFTKEEQMFAAKPARKVVKVRPLKALKDFAK